MRLSYSVGRVPHSPVESDFGSDPAISAAGEPAETDASDVEDGFVDVSELVNRYTVEDLNQSAEAYFAGMPEWEPALAKPFYAHDAPDLLGGFGALLAGLELVHGLRVLDFGAGTGWTSWMMSQIGCELVVCDVSATALKMARERYRRFPLLRQAPQPTFVHFDGRTLEVDDSSVDRVACNDAFHHVANPARVLTEMARVLRPGGMCVMLEPGPYHSTSPQSQAEMRNFGVVERNIRLEEIEAEATEAGFEVIEVGAFSVPLRGSCTPPSSITS